MTELNISAAARTAGVSRTTIQKAIKAGKLSATTNAVGNRVIDLSELLRVYGPLQPLPQGVAMPTRQQTAGEMGSQVASQTALIEVLHEQLRLALEREQQTREQAREDKARLLTLLEIEQQARRDLEQKLLPAPKKKKKEGKNN